MRAASILVAAGLLVASPALMPVSAAELNAVEIMQRNFNVGKISGFVGDVTMVLINGKGQERVRKLAMRARLKDNGIDSQVVLTFTAPGDIKGTAFLQSEHSDADDDLWVYLPALGKSRRLVASNKHDSFFGTDFSYGDVLAPPVAQYRHVLTGSEAIDGADCYVIESTPASERIKSDSGYARKTMWIDKTDFLERKVVFYDTTGRLLKTETTSEHKLMESGKQRWLPLRREMVNHQTEHRTVYRFDRAEISGNLSEKQFDVRSLERE